MVKCLDFFFQSFSECYINGIFFRFGQILLNLACTFAPHHEKSFIPSSFKVSIDHLFWEKEVQYCFGKKSEKVLNFGSQNLYEHCTSTNG